MIVLYSCIELLPQSSNTQIPNHVKGSKILWILEKIIEHMIEALKSFFISQKYYEFDPHVGETACQIRAYHIFELSCLIKKYKINIKNKLHSLENLKKIILVEIERLQSSESKKIKGLKPVSLEVFLVKQQFFVTFNSLEIYLFLCRFLSIYKIFDKYQEPIINYPLLCRNLEINKNLARKIIHQYQIKLSKISCDKILGATKKNYEFILSYKYLSQFLHLDDDGRNVLPCYLVTKVLLKCLQKKDNVILIVCKRKNHFGMIDNIVLPFKFNSQGEFAYFPTDKIEKKQNRPCYVIEGIVNYERNNIEPEKSYISRFLKTGLKKIILANMAIHPQYSGKKLYKLSINPFHYKKNNINKKTCQIEKEFSIMRKTAKLIGCSYENPKLFYIKHIYCDNLVRHTTTINNSKFIMNHNNTSQTLIFI